MNLNLNGVNANTVSVTDYELVTPTVARVIIAFTGTHDGNSIAAAMSEKLKGLAAPIEASYRVIRDNVAVGFVRANREIRQVEEQELRAGYRVMSSNIMMSNKDQTLWDVKSGAAGQYLARHGEEDLSELIQASRTVRTDVPGLRHLAPVTASPKEFVAFATDSGDMDYGFCTVASSDGSKVKVVSHTTGREVVVPSKVIAGVYNVGIKRSVHEKIVQAGISRDDRNQSIEYYTQLYGYDAGYLSEVIKNIEEGSLM